MLRAPAGAAGKPAGRNGAEDGQELRFADDFRSENIAFGRRAIEGDGDMSRIVFDPDVYPGGVEEVRPAGSAKGYRPQVRVVLHMVDLGDDAR